MMEIGHIISEKTGWKLINYIPCDDAGNHVQAQKMYQNNFYSVSSL